MKWFNNFFNNNTTIIIILIIVLLVAFYFNSDFGLGMRQIIEPLENNTVTYYGPNGEYATVSTDSSGNVTITIVDSSGNTNVYTRSTTSNTLYIGPNGATAEVVTDTNGKKTVIVTYPDGTTVVYYNENVNYNYGKPNDYGRPNDYDNYNHYSGEFENITFYGPDGGKAQVVRTPDENTIVITYKNGVTEIYYIDRNDADVETYSGPNGNTAKVITDSNGKKAIEITLSDGSKIYYYSGDVYTYNSNTGNINHYDRYRPYDGVQATSYTGPAGNTATTVTGPAGNSVTTVNPDDYYNSLPEGIYRHQIPPGEEDKYILKSQVVPPVCPKCPDVQCSTVFDETKCPPCPPCSRCPEPSFTCEKIPNYNAFNPKTMPLPVLSDFSSFGM
jgi:hypothetical protein